MTDDALADAARKHAASAHYVLCGIVRHGKALGRTLGFPTANLDLPPDAEIPAGVYASSVDVGGRFFAAVSSVGTRPTVGGTGRNCETHLLDFDRDLYGQTVRVYLCRFLRKEETFGSLDELREAIRKNTEEARRFFSKSEE